MKKQTTIPLLVISMSLISAVAAALLAWVFLITEAPIKTALKQKTNVALQHVLPLFDNQPTEETVQADGVTFYVARKGGQIVGFAGETTSHKGYAGDITVLAGIQPDGTITTVMVAKQNETPGLGTVVCERKREKTLSGILAGKNQTGLPSNRILDQFAGRKAAAGQTPWAVKKDGGDLDAITGATITSRAVGEAVFTIAETFARNLPTLLKEKK